jgi:hypothetical protein
MRKFAELLRQKEFHFFLFFLLLLLFNWPFLSVAAGSGLKGLFRYLFVLWLTLILLLFLIQKALRRGTEQRRGGDD